MLADIEVQDDLEDLLSPINNEDYEVEDDDDDEDPVEQAIAKHTKKAVELVSNGEKVLDLSDILGNNYNNVKDLTQVGNAPFFFCSLGIVYSLAGYGKSWQTAQIIGSNIDDDTLAFYIDDDGANGRKFMNHCHKHNVNFISADRVDIGAKKKMKNLERALTIIEKLSEANKMKKVFILDSLSSLGEGQRINNPEDISPVLYGINNFAEDLGVAIIIIDHATPIRDENRDTVGFKLEGSDSGKIRATTSVCRYDPYDVNAPQDGGYFTVDRTRDSEKFKKGDKFYVGKPKSALKILKAK